jgi:hypothetical protein
MKSQKFILVFIFILLASSKLFPQSRTYKCSFCSEYSTNRYTLDIVNYKYTCIEYRNIFADMLNERTWCSCKCVQDDKINSDKFTFNNNSYVDRKSIIDKKEEDARKYQEERKKIIDAKIARNEKLRLDEEQSRKEEADRLAKIENEERKRLAIEEEKKKEEEQRRMADHYEKELIEVKAKYEKYKEKEAQNKINEQSKLSDLRASKKFYTPGELSSSSIGKNSFTYIGLEGFFYPDIESDRQTSIIIKGFIVQNNGAYYISESKNSKSDFQRIKFGINSQSECTKTNLSSYKNKEVIIACYLNYQKSNLEINGWELYNVNSKNNCLEILWMYDKDENNLTFDIELDIKNRNKKISQILNK